MTPCLLIPVLYGTQEASEEESLSLEEGKQVSYGIGLGQVLREIQQEPLHYHTCEGALERLQTEMHYVYRYF